jgi:hypothetical protein
MFYIRKINFNIQNLFYYLRNIYYHFIFLYFYSGHPIFLIRINPGNTMIIMIQWSFKKLDIVLFWLWWSIKFESHKIKILYFMLIYTEILKN